MMFKTAKLSFRISYFWLAQMFNNFLLLTYYNILYIPRHLCDACILAINAFICFSSILALVITTSSIVDTKEYSKTFGVRTVRIDREVFLSYIDVFKMVFFVGVPVLVAQYRPLFGILAYVVIISVSFLRYWFGSEFYYNMTLAVLGLRVYKTKDSKIQYVFSDHKIIGDCCQVVNMAAKEKITTGVALDEIMD